MLVALAAVLVAVCLSGWLAWLAWRERRSGDWQTVELRFGRDVTAEAIVAVVGCLAGLPGGRAVALDVESTHDGIRHYLRADQATLETVRGVLRALVPSLRLTPVERRSLAGFGYGRLLRLRGRVGVLRADGIAGVSAALLGALQPVGRDERVLVCWWVRSSRPVRVSQVSRGRQIPADVLAQLKVKNAGSVVRASGVVAVRTGHRKRAWHVQARVLAVLRTRLTAYGQLQSVVCSGRRLARLLARPPLAPGGRYAAAELAGLLAWPVDAPSLPGLSLGTSPLLMPSLRLPKTGRVFGVATWPGAERPIAQPVMGALSHALVAGPTGVGKSTLLANLVAGDMAAGRGVLVLDGKGDTVEAVLARVPAERRDQVIVLDCASAGPQPGLKSFGEGAPELAADVVLGVFSELFRDSWGPLSERYLRAGLVAVAHDPKGTLADVPFVFSDAAYRRRLVGRVRDPLTQATFAAFEGMSEGERAQQLAAPLNRLGALLGRPIVRTVLGQAAPQLDFRRVLGKGQIVLVSLAPGRVGAPAARLIGALVVFGLFQAVQARIGLPAAARRAFMAYVDEPRSLGDLPMPLDTLLEQARGLRVGLTLAPQSMSQLSRTLRDAVLTNVATRVVFRQHADDAHLLARDLPGVKPEGLGELAAFEAVARIALGPGDVAAPVSLRTLPPGPAVNDPAQLRASAAARFGVTPEAVDEALATRHSQSDSTAPVGRRRRG